jgi:hypothetical protein
MKRSIWIRPAAAAIVLLTAWATPVHAAVTGSATESVTPAVFAPTPPRDLASEAAIARQNAVDACLKRNEFGPASAIEAVADGVGDWLVWVRDNDGDLWSCNADAQGLVYANAFVGGDLLEGRGREFLGERPLPAGVVSDEARARELCVSIAGLTQDVEVVATAPDGLGDYLVWLRMADEQLWMCNASEEAKLFVFEAVGFPLDGEDLPLLSAEAPAP